MGEQQKSNDRAAFEKLRKDTRLAAIIAVALGSGMILVTIGVFAVYGGALNKAVLSANKSISDLADALRWFVFILIPCNGIAVMTGIYTLRYLRAERKSAGKTSPT
jgi:hypothetical protein